MERVVALRLSLLVSMGLLPPACSAERLESNDPGTGGTGGTAGFAGGSSSKPKPPSKGGTAGTPAMSQSACTSAQLDPLSGLVGCDEGFSHRPRAVVCTPVALPGAAGGTGEADGGTGPGAKAGLGGSPSEPNCNHDPSLCAALPNGFCAVDDRGPDISFDCEAGCVTDADCGANRVCICGHLESPTGGRCAISNCVTDADCGIGLLCASYQEGCGPGGFACLRDDDLCRSDADCEQEGCGITADIFRPAEARRTCGLSTCGRPFLIEQQARVAPIREGNQWGIANLVPRLDHLSGGARAKQAAHWARLGQMEHASIAAFARFNLQLLALAAPPELVEACTQALADETRHARLCFQLASAFAGQGIAPGPLDIHGSLGSASLGDIVDLVIAEGCVGETSAVLEALAAAETATDPVIVEVYAEIAGDEHRHAALAFRFLRWALEQADAEVRPRIEAALQAMPATSTGRDVVAPCLRALLGCPPSEAAAIG